MEIEAKLAVPDAKTLLRLRRRRKLSGYTLRPSGTAVLHDTYLDTARRLLLSAGLACRRRRSRGRILYTLKGMGRAHGAVHAREETEVALRRDRPPAQWPPGAARDRVLAIIGEEPLGPLVEIRQRRTKRLVLHGQRVVAELCLDTARLPGEDHLFREVEIELRSAGNGRDLASMVSVLKEEWGLADVSESKFTRALALASPRTRVALVRTPARPIHAGLHPGATMAEAARRTIAFHFQRMLDHEPGTRLGEDPEELHDMRVATRRMRAALQLFAAHLDPLVMKPHRRGLRLTGRALGAVRDLDVFHGKTLRYLESLPEVRRGEIDSFLAGLNRARDAARAELIRYLDSKEYRTFCERLGEFLDAPGAGAASTTGSEGQPLAHQVRHVVPGELYRHYAAVRAFDDPLSEPDAHLGLYHRLRITGKSLRYTLEFFADVLGNGSKYLIERMKALQDHLGDLQDAVVASGLLNDFLRRGVWGADEGQEVGLPVRVAPGVAAYLTARQNEMQKLLETFPPVWDQVRKPEFGRRLGALAVTLVTRGDRSRAAGGAEDAEEE